MVNPLQGVPGGFVPMLGRSCFDSTDSFGHRILRVPGLLKNQADRKADVDDNISQSRSSSGIGAFLLGCSLRGL